MFIPRSCALTNLICLYTTKEPMINATVIANWPTTSAFRKMIPLVDVVYFPLRTSIGLNEESTNAG